MAADLPGKVGQDEGALAITGPREQRGSFIALAVIWVPMAAGAFWLVVLTERRLRGARQGDHLGLSRCSISEDLSASSR